MQRSRFAQTPTRIRDQILGPRRRSVLTLVAAVVMVVLSVPAAAEPVAAFQFSTNAWSGGSNTSQSGLVVTMTTTGNTLLVIATTLGERGYQAGDYAPALPSDAPAMQVGTTANCDVGQLCPTGSLTITFEHPVTNPVLHFAGIGGDSHYLDGTPQSQTQTQLTLTTAGITLAKTAGSNLTVSGNTIRPTSTLSGTDCDTTAQPTAPTPAGATAGCGSVQLIGTVSSVSFDTALLNTVYVLGGAPSTTDQLDDVFNIVYSVGEDFGDAPAGYDPVSNAARHVLTDLRLASGVTAENAALANSVAPVNVSATATGDSDDAFAVNGAGIITSGSVAPVRGDLNSYTFVVTNTGAVTLDNIVVSDPMFVDMFTGGVVPCGSGPLEPGMSRTCSAVQWTITDEQVPCPAATQSTTESTVAVTTESTVAVTTESTVAVTLVATEELATIAPANTAEATTPPTEPDTTTEPDSTVPAATTNPVVATDPVVATTEPPASTVLAPVAGFFGQSRGLTRSSSAAACTVSIVNTASVVGETPTGENVTDTDTEVVGDNSELSLTTPPTVSVTNPPTVPPTVAVGGLSGSAGAPSGGAGAAPPGPLPVTGSGSADATALIATIVGLAGVALLGLTRRRRHQPANRATAPDETR